MIARIDEARAAGDTVGGVFEVSGHAASRSAWAATSSGTAGWTRRWPARS